MDRFALDALVLPYRTIPPERVEEPHDPEATNQLTSHFGAPAVLVPGGYAQGNLPIAIQFFGRQNDDLTVLKIAGGSNTSASIPKMGNFTQNARDSTS